MKRKYREAMRAAARRLVDRKEDDDEDAIEARDWHDEWVQSNDARETTSQTETQQ